MCKHTTQQVLGTCHLSSIVSQLFRGDNRLQARAYFQVAPPLDQQKPTADGHVGGLDGRARAPSCSEQRSRKLLPESGTGWHFFFGGLF